MQMVMRVPAISNVPNLQDERGDRGGVAGAINCNTVPVGVKGLHL